MCSLSDCLPCSQHKSGNSGTAEHVMSKRDVATNTEPAGIDSDAQNHSSLAPGATVTAGNTSQRNGGAASGDVPGKEEADVKSSWDPQERGRSSHTNSRKMSLLPENSYYQVHHFSCIAPLGGYTSLVQRTGDGLDVLAAVPLRCEPQLERGRRIHARLSPNSWFGYPQLISNATSELLQLHESHSCVLYGFPTALRL